MLTTSNAGVDLKDFMPKQVTIIFQNGLNRTRENNRKIKDTIENEKPALTRAKSWANKDVY